VKRSCPSRNVIGSSPNATDSRPETNMIASIESRISVRLLAPSSDAECSTGIQANQAASPTIISTP
jgi:hypothetical protein